MNIKLEKQLRLTKKASLEVVKLSSEKRKVILLEIAKELRQQKKEILEANKRDVAETKLRGKTKAFIDRLTLSDKGFAGMVAQIETVARLSNAPGEVIEERVLENGILLKKIRFPLGVVAMIYESRPNVTVDVAGICLKSGNSVILKGGSEAVHTNKALVNCIHIVLKKFGVSLYAVCFLEGVTHEDIAEMLSRNDLIDVVIPRGSYGLATAVAQSSKIPILFHSAGGARAYIDKSADIDMAIDLVVNAKTQRNSVCNALDCVLVHGEVAEQVLPELGKRLQSNGIEMRVDETVRKILDQIKTDIQTIRAIEEDSSTEFLDAVVLIRVVGNEREALDFLEKYSHHHTEMLIAEDERVIERFIQEVDTAAVMVNCSSRLHDGGEFGMGAEMGTATGKFHARGPVGVRELMTYKWVAYGKGQVKK